mmetsp:Transcript_5174/g.15196  ORF Transcript_5174/g.15196 Transcript_5174/m.15196 type:complete len:732 (-) Transcript_5174:110-2305(-)
MEELSADEKRYGEVGFVHKGVVHSTYAALASSPPDKEPSQVVAEDVPEAVNGTQALDASEKGGCCALSLKLVGEAVGEAAHLHAALLKAMGTVLQWGCPLLGVLLSICAQALSARLATVYYIRYMHQVEVMSERCSKRDDMGDPLSQKWVDAHLNYPQKLQDLVAAWIQDPLELPHFVWDLTLVPLPLLCVCLILWKGDAYMWAKVTICFALLNFGRAVCHVATVVPDSQGWQACKDRITNFGAHPHGVEEMSQVDVHWRTATFRSMGRLVEAEATGMRYCGDMVYSGQTFIILLFALGLCEVLRRNWPDARWVLRLAVAISFPFAAIASMAALAARYHYTLDVILATALTFLLYDSSILASGCAWWAAFVPAKSPARQAEFNHVNEEKPPVTATYTAMGMISILAEFVFALLVMWDCTIHGQVVVAAIYGASVSSVSLILVLYSWMDADLRVLPVIARLPLCLVLGSSHTIVLWKLYQSYKKKSMSEDLYVMKVLNATLQSVPLVCLQVYSLTRWPDEGTLWMRYIQVCACFYCVGDAVAHGDGLHTSVLKDMVRNSLWRSLLVTFRVAEVAARVVAIATLHYFMRHVGVDYGAVALCLIDLLLGVLLVRCMPADERSLPPKCWATLLFAAVSIFTNINLFERNKEHRRIADVLCTVRLLEFLFGGAMGMYYVKFYPGGMAALSVFVGDTMGMTAILASSVVLYLVLIVVWLEVRRSLLPQQWELEGLDE